MGQELLDDPAIISAIDEETEFNALVVCVMGLCMHHKHFPYFELSYNCLLLSLCFAVSLQEEEAALLESLLGER